MGSFDSDNKKCHSDPVKIKKLPKQCAAFVYDGVTCNGAYAIVPTYSEKDLRNEQLIITNL